MSMGRFRTNTFEETDKEHWELSSFFLLDHLPLANFPRLTAIRVMKDFV